MPITPAQDLAIRAWAQAKADAIAAIKTELDARNAMLAACYPQHQPGAELEGTYNIELGNDYKLKGVFGTTYTVNKDALPATLLDLTAAGEAGAHAAEKLFKYKPELLVSVYKQLVPSVKVIADTCIISKPSSPQFEIVAPKVKEA